eukprot:scaffold5868_cov15-Tisochrysis_lutea.AAC.1
MSECKKSTHLGLQDAAVRGEQRRRCLRRGACGRGMEGCMQEVKQAPSSWAPHPAPHPRSTPHAPGQQQARGTGRGCQQHPRQAYTVGLVLLWAASEAPRKQQQQGAETPL